MPDRPADYRGDDDGEAPRAEAPSTIERAATATSIKDKPSVQLGELNIQMLPEYDNGKRIGYALADPERDLVIARGKTRGMAIYDLCRNAKRLVAMFTRPVSTRPTKEEREAHLKLL